MSRDERRDRTPSRARRRAPSLIHQEGDARKAPRRRLTKGVYEAKLARLQIELVKLQKWISRKGLKVVVLVGSGDMPVVGSRK